MAIPSFHSHPRSGWLALGLMAVLPVAFARAQTPADTAHFLVELITVEDGLPQGMVQCMLQDRSGYMWFGTRGGLARSDGYSFSAYHTDDMDSTSISSNIIRELMEDRDGYLWLGMESGAIDRFDPRTGRSTHVVDGGDADDAGWRTVNTLREDTAGNIWASYGNGTFLVSLKNSGAGKPTMKDARAAFPGIPWPAHVGDLEVAANGDLWLAYADSLMIVDAGIHACVARWAGHFEPYSPSEVANQPAFRRTPDGKGMYLVRTTSIHRFDGPMDNGCHTQAVGSQRDALYSMLAVDGYIWFSTDAQYRISERTQRTERVRWNELNGRRLSETLRVVSWMEDRSGNLWAGTNGYGVLKVTRISQRFHRLPGVEQLFRTNMSGCLALLSSDAIHTVNRSGKIEDPALFGRLRAEGLIPAQKAWGSDAEGNAWMSTAPTWFDKPRLTKVSPSGVLDFPDIIPPSLAPRGIYPGNGDELWVLATTADEDWGYVEQVIRIDSRSGTTIAQYAVPWTRLNWHDVSSAELGSDGSFWLATKQGLFVLHPATNTWETFRHQDGDPHSLPTNSVLGISFDPQDPLHLLWIGTGDAGLMQFDTRSGVVRRYSGADGIPSETIYGVLPDAQGNLWCSTGHGLFRLDPRTGRMRHFTSADGVLGSEFNTFGTAKAADGRLFFASSEGTTWFHPEDFDVPALSSATVLTGLRLTNERVVEGSFMLPGADAPLLPEAIQNVKSITLPYDQRMITFTFACMDHTAPERNTFRYRLGGFSKDWIDAGTAHEATFTNLGPGLYTFEVQGATSEGVWDEEGTSISLIITPPWWGTWWFRIASAVCIVAALYGFYRYRLFQALKVVRVRERIARDLHDEIGSTLSSVQLYSAVAQRKAHEGSSETAALLGHITEGTTSVLEAMNDIVWAVNAGNDNMARVSQRMNSYAMRLTDAKDCELELKVQEDLLNDHLGMTQRRNLYLVFKEAVNNAVKYSDCTTLTIELLKEGTTFILRVTDDGKGFDPGAAADHGGLGGNGLGNMHRRAEEMGGSLELRCAPGMGTTVELRFKTNERKSRVSLTTRDSDRR